MHKKLGVTLICVSAIFACGQVPSPKYQVGTITAVVAHQNGPTEPGTARYEVSVKIGNVVYVALYAPPNGANSVEYSPGMDMLFWVGTNTLTFNSKLSGTTEIPILRRQTLAPQNGLDLSKAPSQYFSMKQQHLSEALGLTDVQLARIKPTLEQEAGEAGQILQNPVLSRENKLKRYENIVRSSDAQIRPLLSQTQVDKLLELRKQQKADVKKLIAKQRTANKE